MKKPTGVLLIIVPIIIFFSCISDRKMDAGRNVAILMGAQDYSVGFEKKVTSDKGGRDWLSLRLIGLPVVFSDLPDKSTSFAAITFVNSLTKDEYNKADGVKVILETDSLTEMKEYEFRDIKVANSYFDIIRSFFENFNNNKFPFIDTSYLPPEFILDLSTKTEEMGLLNADGVSFTGFKFANLELNNKACIVIWADKKNANELLKYSFTLLRENNKIIQISIND